MQINLSLVACENNSPVRPCAVAGFSFGGSAMEAKAFVFIMSLVFPNGALPPHSEPMPDLQSCLERVAKVHADFVAENDTFRFVAGCVQVSTKTNPA